MKFFLFNIIYLFIFLLNSCGPEFLEFEAIKTNENALLYYGSDEWPISCYFHDPKGKAFGRDLPIFSQAWVWAETKDGAHIHAKGKKEGGFVVADNIYYSKGKKVGPAYIDLPGAELMPEIKTPDDLERICQESIDRYHPGKGYKLIGMVASRSTKLASNVLDNAFPVVVGEKNSPQKITRVVIFGDSISDTGRLRKWTQVMPAYPFFFGRFSNGGTWSDFLADAGDVAVLNYSTGGAVSKSNITSTVKEIINYIKDVGRYFITGSVRNFITDYRKNELTNNKVPNADRTLFVLWVGANDFLSKFDRRSEINNFIDNPNLPGVGSQSVIDQTVLNIITEVRGLISIGAKNIVVGNLPDIGTTPRMSVDSKYKTDSPEDKLEFAEKLSEIIAAFNGKLVTELAKVQAPVGGRIILFDAAQALKNLMTSKGPAGEANFDYGIDLQKSFRDLGAPGKQAIKIGERCYQGGYLGSKNPSDICTNPSSMLFWDEVHPTAKGHCGLSFILHYQLSQAGLLKTPKWQDYQKVCQ